MAARKWRIHHYLWHEVRSGWLSFDPATQAAITNLGWEPPRPDVDVAHPETIDKKWDTILYDWLGDTYSSHVNSVFWKIHGWVDDRIENWKKANNVVAPIPWKGKWVGKAMDQPRHDSFLSAFAAVVGHDHHGHTHGNLQKMEKVVAAIARGGRFCHFYDDVNLPE